MSNPKLERYLQQALDYYDEGKDLSEIRALFSEEGLDPELISYILRLVDEFAVEEERNQEKIRSARLMMIFGTMVTGVGLLISYMFYLQQYLHGYYLVIAFTPVVGGVFLLWKGWSLARKLSAYQPEIDDTKLKLTRRFK